MMRGVIGWRAAAEAAGCALTVALFALLAWLYMLATPEQMSAEYDWAVEESRLAEAQS